MSQVIKSSLTLLMACAGGWLFAWIGTPLPWLLGALFVTGLLGLLSWVGPCPTGGLRLGQLSIGLALGLYFTPDVINTLLGLAHWILITGLFTCLMSMGGAVWLQRSLCLDARTSFYAAAIGAASDMATQAQRCGARSDLVAISHSVRVTLIVSVVPFLASAMPHADSAVSLSALPVMGLVQTVLLILAAIAGALFTDRLSGPNPWVLGPLLVAAVAAVSLPESRLHPTLVASGQILLGWNLGQKFSLSLFYEAPRLVLASALMTIGFSLLALGLALSIWLGTDLSWTTSFVATTPGGIAEMALTAKALALNPPAVTAFQAIRLVLMVSGANLMIRLCQRWGWLK